MKRTLQLFLAMVIAMPLVMAFASLSALATETPTPEFDCYLVVDEKAPLPDVTFTYTITAGTPITDTSPHILAGLVTTVGDKTYPQIAPVRFTNSDTTTSVVENDSVGVFDANKPQKYATKTVTVDFSNVTFSEVGIYRYNITETVTASDNTNTAVSPVADSNDIIVYKTNYDSTDANAKAVMCKVSPDTQVQTNATVGTTCGTRYMDVYVVNSDSGPKVASYVLHKTTTLSTVSTAGDPVDDKSNGVVNSVSSHSLTFGKEVTGNQASSNQYFDFTITFQGLTTNEKYAVILPSATENTQNNPLALEALNNGDSNSSSFTFHLKDGEYVTIQGLPDGFNYTLSEHPNGQGYTSSPGINGNDNSAESGIDYKDGVTDAQSDIRGTDVTTSVKTGFTNSRGGVIPTGLLLTVTPFVVGLFLFGALFVYMMARKRRTY